MKRLEFITKIEQYSDISELTSDEQHLIQLARDAAQKSYSPYSKFKVGTAILLENGEIITGNNQENAAYPSGLCAERTAIFWANSQFPDSGVKKLAISAFNTHGIVENPTAPCGACRQVMIETEVRFDMPMKTILDGKNAIYVSNSAANLLPLSFTSTDLDFE